MTLTSDLDRWPWELFFG